MTRLYHHGRKLRLTPHVGLLIRPNEAVRSSVNRVRRVNVFRQDYFEIVTNKIRYLVVSANARHHIRERYVPLLFRRRCNISMVLNFLVIRLSVAPVNSHRHQDNENVRLLTRLIIGVICVTANLRTWPVICLRVNKWKSCSVRTILLTRCTVNGPMKVLLGVLMKNVPVLCIRISALVVGLRILLVVDGVLAPQRAMRPRREVRMRAARNELILRRLTRRIRATVWLRAKVRRGKDLSRDRIILQGIVFPGSTVPHDVNVKRVILRLLVTIARKSKDCKNSADERRISRVVMFKGIYPFSPAICAIACSVTILRLK